MEDAPDRRDVEDRLRERSASLHAISLDRELRVTAGVITELLDLLGEAATVLGRFDPAAAAALRRKALEATWVLRQDHTLADEAPRVWT